MKILRWFLRPVAAIETVRIERVGRLVEGSRRGPFGGLACCCGVARRPLPRSPRQQTRSSGFLRQQSRRSLVGRLGDLGRAAASDRLGLFPRFRSSDLTGPIQQALVLQRLMLAENRMLHRAVRFRSRGEQPARRGILTIDELQRRIEIPLRGPPARRPA